VKQLAAILACLLLIVAQSLAGLRPVSSSAPAGEAACCSTCDQCACCVDTPAPDSQPVSSSMLPVRTICQSIVPPAAGVSFELASICRLAGHPFRAGEPSMLTVPLFQWNCTFLI
jgi:hypothetical protein